MNDHSVRTVILSAVEGSLPLYAFRAEEGILTMPHTSQLLRAVTS